MRRAAPLCRFVALAGSWCEGESRSGRPLPAVPRVYWHQWSAWFDRELAELGGGRSGTLSLPLTATEEERLLRGAETGRPRACGTIAIYGTERESAAMLADACRACGYEVVALATAEVSLLGCADCWHLRSADMRQRGICNFAIVSGRPAGCAVVCRCELSAG